MQDDSTEWQARGCGQDALQEKDERGRRGQEVKMSTCHLRVMAGRKGVLHKRVLLHPSDDVNPDTLATAPAKDKELHHYDGEQAFLEASVDEGIYIKISKENQKLPRAVGLLNKIYGLVLAERCWFNKFGDGRTTEVAEGSGVAEQDLRARTGGKVLVQQIRRR